MIEILEGPKNVPLEEGVRKEYPGVMALYSRIRVEGKEAYNLDEALAEVRSKIGFGLERLKDLPKIRAYRDFYWRMGIDPTKQRPASEALIRRLIKKGTIPRISFIVDAGNLASIETMVPIGIYDTRFVYGDLRLRLAEKGEIFIDIAGKEKALNPHEIVLADEKGPLHIFPYRDSFRTRVRKDTEEIFVVACGVDGIKMGDLRLALERVLYWLSAL